MIDAFKHDVDIHTKTASDVNGVPLDEVTPTMRREAKAVNFGIVYGISDFGLSNNLGITRKRAKEFIEKYLETFKGVDKYMTDIVKFAKEHGYVETLYNRRRSLPEINAKNKIEPMNIVFETVLLSFAPVHFIKIREKRIKPISTLLKKMAPTKRFRTSTIWAISRSLKKETFF